MLEPEQGAATATFAKVSQTNAADVSAAPDSRAMTLRVGKDAPLQGAAGVANRARRPCDAGTVRTSRAGAFEMILRFPQMVRCAEKPATEPCGKWHWVQNIVRARHQVGRTPLDASGRAALRSFGAWRKQRAARAQGVDARKDSGCPLGTQYRSGASTSEDAPERCRDGLPAMSDTSAATRLAESGAMRGTPESPRMVIHGSRDTPRRGLFEAAKDMLAEDEWKRNRHKHRIIIKSTRP